MTNASFKARMEKKKNTLHISISNISIKKIQVFKHIRMIDLIQ